MTKHPPHEFNSDTVLDRLLTYRETSNLLGVTERTIFALVRGGDLPVIRFGRSVRFDPADARAFIEKSKRPSNLLCEEVTDAR